MEEYKKPQWLIDAENEIEQFSETIYGSASQGRINRTAAALTSITKWNESEEAKQAQINGGKVAGKIAYKNGTGIFGISPERRSQISSANGKKATETMRAEGIGFFGLTFEQRSEQGKKGQLTHDKNGTGMKNWSFEERSKFNKEIAKRSKKSPKHNSKQLKAKSMQKYLDMLPSLPEEFTNKVVKQLFVDLGYNPNTNMFYKKMLEANKIEIIHQGKPGSNNDVTIYKKIETNGNETV